MFDIIVLGGGKLEKEFEENLKEKPEGKAYIKINGKMMAEYVLEMVKTASENMGNTGQIFFVAPSENIPEYIKRFISLMARNGSVSDKIPQDIKGMVNNTCVGGKSVIESLKNGLQLCQNEKIFVIPCDIPLATPKSFEDFASKSIESNADFSYSFVRKEISEEKFPNLRHTYVKLKEGTFCGGSFMMVSKSKFSKCEELFKKITEGRKEPLKLVSLFGFINIIKMLFHVLTIDELIKKGKELLGAEVFAMESKFPEMAFNVDKLEDLKRAEKEMEK